jgi:Uri superfamily endonuclease
MDVLTTYCLLIYKSSPGTIRVGRLGTYEFPEGYYIYTGSAKRGMEARIRRHVSREKRRHWHIDYLLDEGVVEDVYLLPGGECEVNRAVFSLPGATLMVRKFGSMDCVCPSHLAYFGGETPSLESTGYAVKKIFK